MKFDNKLKYLNGDFTYIRMLDGVDYKDIFKVKIDMCGVIYNSYKLLAPVEIYKSKIFAYKCICNNNENHIISKNDILLAESYFINSFKPRINRK